MKIGWKLYYFSCNSVTSLWSNHFIALSTRPYHSKAKICLKNLIKIIIKLSKSLLDILGWKSSVVWTKWLFHIFVWKKILLLIQNIFRYICILVNLKQSIHWYHFAFQILFWMMTILLGEAELDYIRVASQPNVTLFCIYVRMQ